VQAGRGLGWLSRGFGGLRQTTPRVVTAGRGAASMFPLSISSNGRYLQQADGTPFLLKGDTVWSLATNATTTQIDSYLDDRQAKGMTAVLFSAPERAYTNQTPTYRNVNGDDPFTSHSGDTTNWVLNNAYWAHVDYLVNECLARGIVCMVNPAYWGYGDTPPSLDGWDQEISSASDAALQAYGAALANRYTQGNVIWCLGGDDDLGASGDYGSVTDRTKQWQIVVGMRTVRTTDLITFHTARNGTSGPNGEAALACNSTYAGFNLNNVYSQDGTTDAAALASTAYARSPTRPLFHIEAGYENTDSDAENMTVPAIQTVLRGGIVGFFGGHDALWHLGNVAPSTGGAASVLSTYLSGSWLTLGYFGALLDSYQWHLLEPKIDTSLVTTALGSGASAICPALASDGSFALIWTNGSNLTVNMAAFTPSSVRARWWNWQTGAFTAIANYSNTGTQAFTAPGARILVLDAA
jgi:hypothetical protein